jgi:hypothetical protein
MNDQLPALVEAGQLATPDGATIVPALIANAGARAGSRYVKFFTANKRNPHTRRAYARACGSFFAWCEERGVILPAVRPFDVAAWFIAGQVVPINSPAAVRGPKYVVRRRCSMPPSGASSSTASRPGPCATYATAL